MYPPLPRSFYDRKTERVARDLVGLFLVREDALGRRVVRINETEAYLGPHDLAAHTSKGRTPRTEVMFGSPGVAYVYFVYGMHWCLNAVTERQGHGAAVLIRGAEAVDWVARLDGPARLTKALGIDKALNGCDLTLGERLWCSERAHKPRLLRTPRIGVDYAGEWAAKLLRFTPK
jgi:DNA-3-methyladenine glycosylase